jgi:uncharacterized protein
MTSGSAPVRAVVDTNLIVSGIVMARGQPLQLVDAWHDRAFVLLVSAPLRAEYERVLARPKLLERYAASAERAGAFLALVASRAEPVEPRDRLPVPVRDPKDEMVIAAALGGDADFLVTGDKDLLALAHDPRLGRLRIVTAAEFLAVLRSRRQAG